MAMAINMGLPYTEKLQKRKTSSIETEKSYKKNLYKTIESRK
jgi:hypothetical protein